jgi:peptide/nickel transport system permease protein
MSLPVGEVEVASEQLGAETPSVLEKAIEGRSLGQIAWSRLKRDKVALAGGIIMLLVILVAILAPVITKLYGHAPNDPNYDLIDPDTNFPIGPFSGASSSHWLGVEPVDGRDILARLIYGAQTSMIVGFASTFLSLIIGVTLGVIAGYYRGWVDTVISRTMDVILSFPTLLFAIALLAIFNSVNSFLGLSGQPLRFVLIIFLLGFFGWPYIGRIVRGQVLSMREKEFIDAARSLGASDYRIITREIMPNLVGAILVYTTLFVPTNILGEAGYSFLGVGFQPPTASWGQMLSNAAKAVDVDPFYLFCPGMAIFITVLAFNLFGDGLRDALDPKSTR